MKLIIFISLLLFIGLSFRPTQTYQQARNYGIWSDILNASPQLGNQPSQYFLCGYAVKQSRWTKNLWNCNCGQRWYRWRKSYRCNWCQNTFWTQTAAFKAIYCRYDDWNKQRQVFFETGHGQTRNWREFKCPKDQYASRVAPKFGWQQDQDTGFVGLLMKCQNNKMTQSTMVQDNYAIPPTQLSRNKPGTFISGFQIKYQKNWKQTGIKFHFEPMVRISKVEFKFDMLIDNIRGSPVLIDTATVLNEGTQSAQKTVSFSKQYGVVNTFSNSNSVTNSYQISTSVSAQIPILSGSVGAQMTSTYSKSFTSQFGFGKQLKTTYTSNQQMLVIVPSCKKVDVMTIINEQKMNIPYEATLTFVDRYTGDFIGKSLVKGIWDGVLTSAIRTQIKETPIPNCGSNSATNTNNSSNNSSNNSQSSQNSNSKK